MNGKIMAINFISIDSPRPLRHSRLLKRWIESCIEAEKRTLGELSIAFCSDGYIREQNVAFLSHDYETDILTFSYNEQKMIAGDLLISTDTVKSNAKRYKVSYSRELHRVIIHGVLHLIGYDDVTEKLAEKMREREDFYLGELDKMNNDI